MTVPESSGSQDPKVVQTDGFGNVVGHPDLVKPVAGSAKYVSGGTFLARTYALDYLRYQDATEHATGHRPPNNTINLQNVPVTPANVASVPASFVLAQTGLMSPEVPPVAAPPAPSAPTTPLLIPLTGSAQAAPVPITHSKRGPAQSAPQIPQQHKKTRKGSAYFMEWLPVAPSRSVDLWSTRSTTSDRLSDLTQFDLELRSDLDNAAHFASTAWYLPFTPQLGAIISAVELELSNIVSYSQTFGGKRATAYGDGFPKINVTVKLATAFHHKRYVRGLRMAALLSSNSLTYPGRLLLHNILQEKTTYDTLHPEQRRQTLDVRPILDTSGDRNTVTYTGASMVEGFHIMLDRLTLSQSDEIHIITASVQATILEKLKLG